MKNLKEQLLITSVNNLFETLYFLESIIKVTLTTCSNKEICSTYYNLQANEKRTLSEERNNYINMLTLALDQLNNLKEINLIIEKEISSLK